MYRTIYNKNTGKLIISRRISDEMLADRLAQHTNQASLNVACENIDKYQVNLETLQLEESG